MVSGGSSSAVATTWTWLPRLRDRLGQIDQRALASGGEMLGYAATVPLRDGLQELLAWSRAT